MDGRTNSRGAGRKISVMVELAGSMIPVIAAVIAALVLIVHRTASDIIAADSEALMETETMGLVRQVEGWMDVVIAQLEAQRATLEQVDMTPEEELDYIRYMVDPGGAFPGGMYLGTTDHRMIHASWVPDASFDPVARGWYQEGLRNERFRFSDPYLDAITDEIVVPASCVLRDRDGVVRGVAAGDVELTEISKILSDVRIKETGGAFLVDAATLIVIGAGDHGAVGLTISELPEGSVYAQAGSWIRARQEGPRTAPADGQTMRYHLARVPDSDWMVVSHVPQAEITREVRSLTAFLTAAAVVTIAALGILVAAVSSKVVVGPVRELDRAARSIADGALDAKIDLDSHDEFGTLAASFRAMVERLHTYQGYIDEIAGALDQIAQGDLTFRSELEYTGEFAKIKTAMENISQSLDHTISRIDRASRQVSERAGRLSSDSRMMSQGAADQSAAVQDLSATISELSRQVHQNASDAQAVSAEARAAAERVSECDQRMQELIRSMADIASTSDEIDKIIKIIEDIAFQTDILALNAAVEAARAGDAGKGFGVVAEEVRTLADRSAGAAQRTAALIRASEDAARRGSAIADETAASLLSTVRDITSVTGAVDAIARASEAQAGSIAQVSAGIGRISSVVRDNSAASEQAASSSQELFLQAETLKDLVEKFRSRKGDGRPAPGL